MESKHEKEREGTRVGIREVLEGEEEDKVWFLSLGRTRGGRGFD